MLLSTLDQFAHKLFDIYCEPVVSKPCIATSALYFLITSPSSPAAVAKYCYEYVSFLSVCSFNSKTTQPNLRIFLYMLPVATVFFDGVVIRYVSYYGANGPSTTLKFTKWWYQLDVKTTTLWSIKKRDTFIFSITLANI